MPPDKVREPWWPGQGDTQDVRSRAPRRSWGRVVDPDGASDRGRARPGVPASGENVFRTFMRRMEGECRAVRTGKDGSLQRRKSARRRARTSAFDVRHDDDFEERALGGISLAPGGTRTGLTVVMRRGL